MAESKTKEAENKTAPKAEGKSTEAKKETPKKESEKQEENKPDAKVKAEKTTTPVPTPEADPVKTEAKQEKAESDAVTPKAEKKAEKEITKETTEEVKDQQAADATVNSKLSDEEVKVKKGEVQVEADDISRTSAGSGEPGSIVNTEKKDKQAEAEADTDDEDDDITDEPDDQDGGKPERKEALSPEDRKKEMEKFRKDFDWDAVGKYDDVYSSSEQKKLEKIYDETLTSINEQDVIDGTVVSITSREVVVNIGYKSDGVISKSELRYKEDLKIGDTVEVFVESQEDKNGQLVLSHKKARALRAWERVNDALSTQEVIKGHVKCRTKGGLIVDVFGIEAFLPGSQIDVKPIRDYDIYVDKTMEFKVVKINKEFKNVVVSHKALIEAELEEQKKEIISQLEKGQVLEGTVKNITSYGVFIDLGGVDGLVHITDLSWGRVNHPEEVVELDEKVKVVILDFDDEKKRIALGMKQLEGHPWDKLDDKLQVGDKVKGKVVVVADYPARSGRIDTRFRDLLVQSFAASTGFFQCGR